MLVEDAGVTDDQAQSCLALARISTSDTSFVEQVRALGVQHELLDEGLAELAAVMEGCAPLVTDRVEIVADLKIARGLDYYTGTVFETRLDGLRRPGLDLLGWPLRRARHRRAYDVPRRRHLARGEPGARAVAGQGRRRGGPLGAERGPRRRGRRGAPDRQRRPGRAAARQRRRLRGRARGPEVRQADPVRRAPGHPLRPLPRRRRARPPRSRTSAAASRPRST